MPPYVSSFQPPSALDFQPHGQDVNHRVLVIEDDPDTCSNLSDILEIDGCDVDVAHTLTTALSRDNWSDYLAIILDWRLPDGNAESLLPELRKLAPEAAVIVETGAAELDGAVTALRYGAVDYIVKPIDPDALRMGIRRVIERRRLQREKERSESAFRQLVEAALSLIVIVRPEGAIVYLNPFAEQLTGYRSCDVAGRDFIELLIARENQPRCVELLSQIVSGVPTREFECQILSSDGSTRWLVCNAQLLEDYEGEPAVLAFGQDFTERKQAEERLLQAERLAAIGRAMAGLAHESRNALQRSQAGLEMLARRVKDQPEALQLISRIQKAQDDLHQLYEEVREYSAPVRLNCQPADLGEILHQEWEHLAIQRQNRHAMLSERPATSDLQCCVDTFAVRQCFRNILENALAACADPVEIEVRYDDTLLDGQEALQIAIRDNGPGLTLEQQRRIFEEFYTTKTHGTGLGMAICRRFVEAQGGRIEARNGEPCGAEIRLILLRNRG